MQTNGLLLTEADAAFIKENNVNIGVSIDSVEETNDFLRYQGHYKKIMEVLIGLEVIKD